MSESDSSHATILLGAAALGAFIATGIGYFVRKEDKTQINRKIKKLQTDLESLKKAVISPERLSNLTQDLVSQTQQAQNILDSQVFDDDSETF
jgi:uncharacterized protein HemX